MTSCAVKEGASRYIDGAITRFDQKNEMFNRPFWDPAFKDLYQRFYMDTVPPKNLPGYDLHDQALVNAAWHLESHYAHGTNSGNHGVYAWDWTRRFDYPRVPSGLKIPAEHPEEITPYIKSAAAFFGASLVGMCELDRRWLYSKSYKKDPNGGTSEALQIPEPFKWAIAVAVEMDYGGVGCAPASPASAATGLGYSKMAFTTGLLAQFIRGLGYQAIPCGNDTALSIPIAIDAGLGEMARNGLLVTPGFGPRVRLAKILTDLPLIPDQPIEFGVWDFCMICEKCAKKCPSRSLPLGPPHSTPNNISNREGVHIWHINAETCLPFWAQNGTDCSVCIRVCPFNKPPGILHDLVRRGIKNLPWLNRWFLWGDDVMGYGKKKSARRFW
ncbi:MAG: reductive dehalogenase [Desulfobacteraceae bacterium]|nr:reductive dehalogenase [Desulfobacteraceae bacterium]